MAIGWGLSHLLLIVWVSMRELSSVIALGLTVLPAKLHQPHSGALGPPRTHARTVAIKQLIPGYLHSTGIEGGYGFFAPNFSSAYQLSFELHYPDDRVAIELPHVRSHATGLRLASYLDRIGQEESESMREVLIRLLVQDEYRLHPDVKYIRAIFASIDPIPSKNKHVGEASRKFQQVYEYRPEAAGD